GSFIGSVLSTQLSYGASIRGNMKSSRTQQTLPSGQWLSVRVCTGTIRPPESASRKETVLRRAPLGKGSPTLTGWPLLDGVMLSKTRGTESLAGDFCLA